MKRFARLCKHNGRRIRLLPIRSFLYIVRRRPATGSGNSLVPYAVINLLSMPQATLRLSRLLLLFAALLACSAHASAASYVVKHCAELQGKDVPASVIGLPTRGALITDASFVAAAAPHNRNG